MAAVRRLDHVGIAVQDTEAAVREYTMRLGLRVVHRENRDVPPVRMTYLDAGNVLIQLLEPRSENSDLARFLDKHGEGVHHLCFGVDDVHRGATALSSEGADGTFPILGGGRGRISAFVPGPLLHGVLIECTEFVRAEDVDGNAGWLSPSESGG